MPKKPQRVPGTLDVKPNREQRRHPEGSPQQDHPLVRDTDAPEPDVPDVRAKNTGHGKKTADKWNQ